MSAAYSSLAARFCFSLQGKALQAAARSKEKKNDLIVGNVSSDSQLENERMFKLRILSQIKVIKIVKPKQSKHFVLLKQKGSKVHC